MANAIGIRVFIQHNITWCSKSLFIQYSAFSLKRWHRPTYHTFNSNVNIKIETMRSSIKILMFGCSLIFILWDNLVCCWLFVLLCLLLINDQQQIHAHCAHKWMPFKKVQMKQKNIQTVTTSVKTSRWHSVAYTL